MSEASMYLLTVAGPPIGPFELKPQTAALRMGRSEQCEIPLPLREDRASRIHARFNFDGSRWRLTDLNSRWGTFVNGVRLTPEADLPLGEGDLIRISPWTFLYSSSSQQNDSVQTDGSPTLVRNVSDAKLIDDQLAVLLESTAAIHSANDERGLADMLIDSALRGTGMSNAAFLRPVDNAGRVQIVSSRYVNTGGAPEPPSFSRSLLAAAANGQVAEVQALGGDIAQSIVAMNITAALCVPIVLGARAEMGGTIAGYLYLDSRGRNAPKPRPNAAPFCVALGRMASLALANLKRIEIERRQASIEAELAAAAATQKWILPARQQCIGAIECFGESRAGRYIGGDFFDIIDLGNGRLAVALGDVSGKGVAAGVLMTAAQGYLHACLVEHGDVGRAIAATNRFVCSRTPDERFVTMWVGVININDRTLSYIDAGHGYAMMFPEGGEPVDLRGGTGVPIGVEPTFQYSAVSTQLPEHARLLVVSDGLIEQTGVVQAADGSLTQDQFGVDAVKAAVKNSSIADAIDGLFGAIIHHAGTDQLADDATAVLVKW